MEVFGMSTPTPVEELIKTGASNLHRFDHPTYNQIHQEMTATVLAATESLRERVKQLEASDVKWLPEPTVSGWYWVRDAAGKKSIKPHNLFNYSIMEQLQSENYYGGKWVFPIEFSGPILPPA